MHREDRSSISSHPDRVLPSWTPTARRPPTSISRRSRDARAAAELLTGDEARRIAVKLRLQVSAHMPRADLPRPPVRSSACRPQNRVGELCEGQCGALSAAGVDRLPLTLDHSTGGPEDGAPGYGHSPRLWPTPSHFQCANLAPEPLGEGAMRKHSKKDRELVKARRRKTVTRKRRNGPKAMRRRSSIAAGQQTRLARFTRERNEALEQQTAIGRCA